MTRRLFADRRAAGRRLAEALGALLRKHPEITDPVLLALPRGGVPVALEVARALRAPLDLVMVRKISVSWQSELAAAAVVDGDEPQLVVNRGIAEQAGMTAADLEDAERRALAEIGRRRRLYLGGRGAVPVEGRDAVVIDDGVATGATVRAALLGVRRRRPRSLTLAVPVAPLDTLERLAPEVDHVVCLESPTPFFAIGSHYDHFEQVPDAEVVRMLREAEIAALPDEGA